MLAREEPTHNSELITQLRAEAVALHAQAVKCTEYKNKVLLYTDAIDKIMAIGELTDEDLHLIARCENNIGICYHHQEMLDIALDAFIHAIKIWKQIKTKTDAHYANAVYIHINICNGFHNLPKRQNDPDIRAQFVDYCIETLKEMSVYFNKAERVLADHERFLLGTLHFYLAEFGTDKQRIETEEFEKTLALLEGIESKEYKYPYQIAHAHHVLGYLYHLKANDQQALGHLESALAFYKTCNQTKQIKECQHNAEKMISGISATSENHYFANAACFFSPSSRRVDESPCMISKPVIYAEF